MDTPTSRRIIQVVDYRPEWIDEFNSLRDWIWPSVSSIAVAIEHVGSTAVPGLAAKPIVDIDIVLPSRDVMPLIVTQLARLGYRHQGDLAIPGREAFRSPQDQPAHHLYACPKDSLALRNHIAFRDHLRAHPADAAAYSGLKKRLPKQFSGDIDRYVAGKTGFILSILSHSGSANAT